MEFPKVSEISLSREKTTWQTTSLLSFASINCRCYFWSETNIIKDPNYAFLFCLKYIIHVWSISSTSLIWLLYFKKLYVVSMISLLMRYTAVHIFPRGTQPY